MLCHSPARHPRPGPVHRAWAQTQFFTVFCAVPVDSCYSLFVLLPTCSKAHSLNTAGMILFYLYLKLASAPYLNTHLATSVCHGGSSSQRGLSTAQGYGEGLTLNVCLVCRGRLNREPSTLLLPQISVLKGSSKYKCLRWPRLGGILPWSGLWTRDELKLLSSAVLGVLRSGILPRSHI